MDSVHNMTENVGLRIVQTIRPIVISDDVMIIIDSAHALLF